MPSTLAWLHHDASPRDRTKRILALFREQGTRDQLGLGAIRDSFSDLFFPGTSTIQTRLRYFLFVPWIYRQLEEDEVPSRRAAAVAREMELALVEPLLSTREEGVFGRSAGEGLKRLPSEVYWGGLGSWGIRRFSASREQYHRGLDQIYRDRKAGRRAPAEGGEGEAAVVTWHAELPPAPEPLTEEATLELTRDEAEFLRDRIVGEHPGSLLAWLALRPLRTEVAFPWEHPLLDSMPEEHVRGLEHARLFSEVTHGAPILYNWMLSERAGREGLVDRYRNAYGRWAGGLDEREVADWSLDELFRITRRQGSHRITPQAEGFVRTWVDLVRAGAEAVPERAEARALIERRESLLKGARSLFRNRKALETRYNGGLGLGRIQFRWRDVQVLLTDLFAGLEAS